MKDHLQEIPGTLTPGVRIARVEEITDAGEILVRIGAAEPVAALSLVPLEDDARDRRVAVTPLEDADGAWLILGLIHNPADPTPRTVEVSADRQLKLTCGKSSLTLAADGRVTLRGKQILSRADGQNRVQGSTVGLN